MRIKTDALGQLRKENETDRSVEVLSGYQCAVDSGSVFCVKLRRVISPPVRDRSTQPIGN